MTIILLGCCAAFLAGLIDSIAGGGGLIQVPALLFLLPNVPIVTLLGTNKLASACGTFASSFHYIRALKIKYSQFLPTLIVAFIGSICGAKVLSHIHNEILRPLIVILLIIITVYTLVKKDLGLISQPRLSNLQRQLALIVIGSLLGFYDGFFGPGTGSILIFCYVSLLGFNFLEGSAFAKLTNLSANVAALLFFIFHQHVLFKIGIPMAIFNMLGNSIGARLAIEKGSGFVRWVFLAVLGAILMQMLPHMLRF